MPMVLYLLTCAFLLLILLRSPWLILRPTVFFCLLMTVMINGAAAFDAPQGHIGFQHLRELRLLATAFPLACLAWVACTPELSRTAESLWQRCRLTLRLPYSLVVGRPERRALYALLLLAVLVIMLYLSHVPVRQTGLWAMLFAPKEYAMAREHSIKLQPSSILRYSYAWHRAIIVPVLLGLLFISWRRVFSPRNIVLGGIALILLLSVMITGHRSTAALMMLYLGIVLMFQRGIIRGGLLLTSLLVLGLVAATFATFAREGILREVTRSSFTHYFITGTIQRISVTPYATGVMSNMYAQEFGLLWGGNIRPLAWLLDIPYVHLANLTALRYVHTAGIVSTQANTCFLFDLQASFGLFWGWLLSLLVISALDFLLRLYRGMNGGILLVSLACLLLSLFALPATALTTALITFGILPIPLLAWSYQKLYAKEFRHRASYYSVPTRHGKDVCRRPALSRGLQQESIGDQRCESST